MTSSSSRRVSCLGFISPRSAALLLALFGLLAHIQQFNYLTVLYDTFPHVPTTRPANPVPATTTNSDRDSYKSSAIGTTVVLDSEVSQTEAVNGTLASLWSQAAAVKPVRWFNLLPSKYQTSDVKATTTTTGELNGNVFVEQDWKARQRDQEKDRNSWEAARTLTRVVRFYAGLCAITCLCGIIGAIRSSLFCTRIFVLSSTVDLFLCALSLISLGIIVTYPNIRSLICEELSNTSTVIIDLDQSSSQQLRSSSGPVLFLGRAASTFWKRTISDAVESNSDSLSSGYWWDSLLDNLLENENCDDVLESVLIPLGLVACLVYLAFRIHFLIVIRNYYVSLLREQMSYHLTSQSNNGTSPHSNERKYSSSSASSSTSTSDFASCLPSSVKVLRFEDSKLINEKMA